MDLHSLLGSGCWRKTGQLWWDGCARFLLSCCVGYNCFVVLCSSKSILILLPRSNLVKNVLKQILAFGLKFITCRKFYKQSWHLETGCGEAVILDKWKYRSCFLLVSADAGTEGNISPDLGGKQLMLVKEEKLASVSMYLKLGEKESVISLNVICFSSKFVECLCNLADNRARSFLSLLWSLEVMRSLFDYDNRTNDGQLPSFNGLQNCTRLLS